MEKQFFYKEKREIGRTTDEKQDLIYGEFTNSFNVSLVIRSVELEDKRRLILLNDMHERLEKVPQFDKKKDKITGWTKERNTFQSEIYLNEEDSKRFIEMFN